MKRFVEPISGIFYNLKVLESAVLDIQTNKQHKHNGDTLAILPIHTPTENRWRIVAVLDPVQDAKRIRKPGKEAPRDNLILVELKDLQPICPID